MAVKVLALVLALAVSINGYPSHGFKYQCVPKINTIPLVSRDDWGAQSPSYITNLTLPVPYVIIHHTYEPGACYSLQDCSRAMRSMQTYHQATQGWADIGYNFAVGGDGSIYEGRGWKAVGAHAAGYNSVSIGIALIGDFVSELPPAHQLELTKELISFGVEQGYISKEYSLIGHRQVRNTECPGDALFQEITTWDRFIPTVDTN
ncbi:PREDICTED: peptidoglycan-recognition protein LB-like [Papilio polytes]|uniref:peptidoglycan-recognition protein LB-like n=1 Tax=Papilio polytes TaxID=76194 RepID=UPI000676208E|nr:PREDICTED: peptidoglycan-recognition protein LB-like [Papilio polytes]